MSGRALSIAAILLLAVGCAPKKNDAHPPGVADCVGAGCNPSGGSGTNPGNDAGVPIGDAATDAALVSVTGTIATTTDQGFAAAGPYTGQVIVRAEGSASSIVETEGGVASTFGLDDVASGLNWFGVQAFGGAGSILPTLQPVQVDGATPVTIVGVDAQTFSTTLFQMSPPQTQATGAAQLILFFVKGSVPASDVSLKSWASAQAVAYDASQGYEIFATPDQGKTGSSGTVILVNVPAVPYPGSLATLQFDAGAGPHAFAVTVAADYVTRAAIAIQ